MHANRPEVVRAILAAVLLATSLSVEAADGSNPCAGIKDSTARLACYDNLFAKPAAATAVAPVAPAAAPVAPAAAPAAPGVASGQVAAPAAAPVAAPIPAAPSVEKQIEDFGLSPEAAQAKKKVDKPATPATPATIESIESTIAALQRRGTGELVLKLANGQVWLQGQADSRVYLKPGDRVTIKKALFGSYMLVSGYYSFKVRRLD